MDFKQILFIKEIKLTKQIYLKNRYIIWNQTWKIVYAKAMCYHFNNTKTGGK